MKIYNCQLREITPPTTIEWNNLPETDMYGLLSHVSYHISKLGIDGNFCILDSTQGLWHINDSVWIQKINNSHIDYIILNLSDHPELNIKHSIDFIHKPVIVLGSNFNTNDYYPYWMLASRDWAQHDTVDVLSKKPSSAVFLNGKPRIPRVYTMCKLMEKSYYTHIDITWGDINFDTSNVIAAIDNIITNIHSSVRMEFPNMSDEFEKFFKVVGSYRLERSHDNLGYFMVASDILNGLDTGYLQIICESRPEVHGFLSEKTFKAIRGGQLFIVQGSVGTIQTLRDMGFDTFDDLIDHNRYDNEPDWIVRTDKMLTVMDEIHSNIEEMYFATVERRQANIDRLKSQELFEYGMQHIRKSINI